MNNKIYSCIIVSLLILISVTSCKKPVLTPGKSSGNLKTKSSYVIGHDIGANLKSNNLEVNASDLFKGLKDGLSGKKSIYSADETKKIMEDLQADMQNKSKELAEKNKKDGIDFLEKNKKQPGVTTLQSGLQYKVITAGNGPVPKDKDSVKVNYSGKLINGTEFDNSYSRKEPVVISVNGVIKGWREALQLMKVGSKWEIYLPSELGYGEQNMSTIPADSVLIFDIELLSIEQAQKK